MLRICLVIVLLVFGVVINAQSLGISAYADFSNDRGQIQKNAPTSNSIPNDNLSTRPGFLLSYQHSITPRLLAEVGVGYVARPLVEKQYVFQINEDDGDFVRLVNTFPTNSFPVASFDGTVFDSTVRFSPLHIVPIRILARYQVEIKTITISVATGVDILYVVNRKSIYPKSGEYFVFDFKTPFDLEDYAIAPIRKMHSIGQLRAGLSKSFTQTVSLRVDLGIYRSITNIYEPGYSVLATDLRSEWQGFDAGLTLMYKLNADRNTSR